MYCRTELPLFGFGDDNVIGKHVDKQWFTRDLWPTKQPTLHCQAMQNSTAHKMPRRGHQRKRLHKKTSLCTFRRTLDPQDTG